MNRRNLFQMLGLGAAATVLPAIEPPAPTRQIMYHAVPRNPGSPYSDMIAMPVLYEDGKPVMPQPAFYVGENNAIRY